MTCLRPATPGFIVTLIATILLALVVFCVPYVKSVYFLKATVSSGSVSGNITFGTLGYCVQLSGNSTCSKPSIGYQLDINDLVGAQVPQVLVKWVTYVLVLNIAALAAAAISALFGLLAHVREMSMVCCSTCFSGLAAAISLVAFVADIAIFFVAKAKIKPNPAQIGNAVWLVLTAWILLFFSGCFFAVGRCCMRGRPPKWIGKKDPERGGPDKGYAEEMRLDAVKAEADRKARQKQGEVGLPAFYETQPLTGLVEGDQVHLDGDKPEPTPPPSANFRGGYAPGRTGTRAMDDYHRNDSSPPSPPQREVRRQQSEHSAYTVPTTTSSPPISNRPSGYGYYNNAPMSTSPPPSNNQLFVPGQLQHYNSNTGSDPYGREYGHTAGGSSYHTAISHDQEPSSYGQPMNDPYAYQPQPSYQPNPYMPSQTPMLPPLTVDYYPPPSTSISPPPVQEPQALHGDRSYTLGGESYGGDGYGSNQLPPLPVHQATLPPGAGAPSYLAFGQPHQPPPIDTTVDAGFHFQTSPRPLPGPSDSPPGYETNANWDTR